jgi:uncharacterized protein DUF5324
VNRENRDAKQGVLHAVGAAVPYAMSATHRAGTYLAPRARRAARAARMGYDERLVPGVERARAATGPARREAMARSEAAMAALRGQITPHEVRCAVRRREARARAGRRVRRLGVLGLVAAGVFAAWKWWERQTSPEWLMEPSPATEVSPEEMDMEMESEMDVDAQREAG